MADIWEGLQTPMFAEDQHDDLGNLQHVIDSVVKDLEDTGESAKKVKDAESSSNKDSGHDLEMEVECIQDDDDETDAINMDCESDDENDDEKTNSNKSSTSKKSNPKQDKRTTAKNKTTDLLLTPRSKINDVVPESPSLCTNMPSSSASSHLLPANLPMLFPQTDTSPTNSDSILSPELSIVDKRPTSRSKAATKKVSKNLNFDMDKCQEKTAVIRLERLNVNDLSSAMKSHTSSESAVHGTTRSEERRSRDSRRSNESESTRRDSRRSNETTESESTRRDPRRSDDSESTRRDSRRSNETTESESTRHESRRSNEAIESESTEQGPRRSSDTVESESIEQRTCEIRRSSDTTENESANQRTCESRRSSDTTENESSEHRSSANRRSNETSECESIGISQPMVTGETSGGVELRSHDVRRSEEINSNTEIGSDTDVVITSEKKSRGPRRANRSSNSNSQQNVAERARRSTDGLGGNNQPNRQVETPPIGRGTRSRDTANSNTSVNDSFPRIIVRRSCPRATNDGPPQLLRQSEATPSVRTTTSRNTPLNLGVNPVVHNIQPIEIAPIENYDETMDTRPKLLADAPRNARGNTVLSSANVTTRRPMRGTSGRQPNILLPVTSMANPPATAVVILHNQRNNTSRDNNTRHQTARNKTPATQDKQNTAENARRDDDRKRSGSGSNVPVNDIISREIEAAVGDFTSRFRQDLELSGYLSRKDRSSISSEETGKHTQDKHKFSRHFVFNVSKDTLPVGLSPSLNITKLSMKTLQEDTVDLRKYMDGYFSTPRSRYGRTLREVAETRTPRHKSSSDADSDKDSDSDVKVKPKRTLRRKKSPRIQSDSGSEIYSEVEGTEEVIDWDDICDQYKTTHRYISDLSSGPKKRTETAGTTSIDSDFENKTSSLHSNKENDSKKRRSSRIQSNSDDETDDRNFQISKNERNNKERRRSSRVQSYSDNDNNDDERVSKKEYPDSTERRRLSKAQNNSGTESDEDGPSRSKRNTHRLSKTESDSGTIEKVEKSKRVSSRSRSDTVDNVDDVEISTVENKTRRSRKESIADDSSSVGDNKVEVPGRRGSLRARGVKENDENHGEMKMAEFSGSKTKPPDTKNRSKGASLSMSDPDEHEEGDVESVRALRKRPSPQETDKEPENTSSKVKKPKSSDKKYIAKPLSKRSSNIGDENRTPAKKRRSSILNAKVINDLKEKFNIIDCFVNISKVSKDIIARDYETSLKSDSMDKTRVKSDVKTCHVSLTRICLPNKNADDVSRAEEGEVSNPDKTGSNPVKTSSVKSRTKSNKTSVEASESVVADTTSDTKTAENKNRTSSRRKRSTTPSIQEDIVSSTQSDSTNQKTDYSNLSNQDGAESENANCVQSSTDLTRSDTPETVNQESSSAFADGTEDDDVNDDVADDDLSKEYAVDYVGCDGDKKFLCKQCGSEFRSAVPTVKHVIHEHCTCKKCDLRFREVHQYNKHMSTCTKGSPDQSEVTAHKIPETLESVNTLNIGQCIRTEKGSIVCALCGKLFAFKYYARAHVQNIHLRKQLKCKQCGTSISKKSEHSCVNEGENEDEPSSAEKDKEVPDDKVGQPVENDSPSDEKDSQSGGKESLSESMCDKNDTLSDKSESVSDRKDVPGDKNESTSDRCDVSGDKFDSPVNEAHLSDNKSDSPDVQCFADRSDGDGSASAQIDEQKVEQKSSDSENKSEKLSKDNKISKLTKDGSIKEPSRVGETSEQLSQSDVSNEKSKLSKSNSKCPDPIKNVHQNIASKNSEMQHSDAKSKNAEIQDSETQNTESKSSSLDESELPSTPVDTSMTEGGASTADEDEIWNTAMGISVNSSQSSTVTKVEIFSTPVGKSMIQSKASTLNKGEFSGTPKLKDKPTVSLSSQSDGQSTPLRTPSVNSEDDSLWDEAVTETKETSGGDVI